MEVGVFAAALEEVTKGSIPMAYCLWCRHTGHRIEPRGLRLLRERGKRSRCISVTHSFLALIHRHRCAPGAPNCRHGARTRTRTQTSASALRLARVWDSSGSDRRVSGSCSQDNIQGVNASCRSDERRRPFFPMPQVRGILAEF